MVIGSIKRLVAGSGGALLATFLGMPILTRQYSPDVYSAWVLFLTVGMALGSIAALRIELAVVLPKSDSDAAALWVLGCFISFSMGLVSVLFVYGVSKLILGEYHDVLNPYIPIIGLWIFCTGLLENSVSWMTRKKYFGALAILNFLVPVLTVFAQLILAKPSNKQIWGLVVGGMLAQGLGTALAVCIAIYRDKKVLLTAGAVRMSYRQIVKYRVYPTYMTMFAILTSIRNRLVLFVVGNSSIPGGAAFYGLAQRFTNVPNRIASAALRPVFFQRATNLGFHEIQTEVMFVLFAIVGLALPPWMAFLFHANDMSGLVFGEAWRETGFYASVISISAMPMLLTNWLDRAFDSLGRQRLSFCLEVVFSIVSVFGLCWGALYMKNLIVGIFIQSVIVGLYYWFWLWMLFKVSGYKNTLIVKLFISFLLMGGFCGLVNDYLAKWLPFPAAPILACLIGYIPPSWLIYRRRHDLKRMITKQT
ncbi:oligosaccharide flippase family protein [Verrucomicrobia bacterium]|nr:oligosaccharide flippase family protein [Verrucomicrobiota bacterium]